MIFFGLGWPSTRPDADRSLGERLDLLLKAFASPGALLPGVLSKIGEVFFFYLFVDQGPVGGLSCGRCGGKQRVLLVRGDERRGLSQCVVVVARPGVVGGISGHVGADGIELDVAVAGEQIESKRGQRHYSDESKCL